LKYLLGIITSEQKGSRNKEGATMDVFFKSEVGRGLTVALISTGITILALLPLFLMEFLHSL